MLATPWPKSFDHPDWWFEVKWDGFRVIVEWDGEVRLRSRRGNDFTASFPELESIRFDRPTVLDGEIVCFDDSGAPDFTALLQRNGVKGAAALRLATKRPVNLMVFDLLEFGETLIDRPIEERWHQLSEIEAQGWTRSEPIRSSGMDVFEAIRVRGLEGMVAKRAGSIYRPGSRSADWRKIANRRQARAIVVGFSPGERSRSRSFGALQLGVHGDGAGLRYVGGVGSGFDDAALASIRDALGQMIRESSVLDRPDLAPEGTVWVEPLLVALVEYKEWTPEGRLRAPVFKGFLDDDPQTVTWGAEGRDLQAAVEGTDSP